MPVCLVGQQIDIQGEYYFNIDKGTPHVMLAELNEALAMQGQATAGGSSAA